MGLRRLSHVLACVLGATAPPRPQAGGTTISQSLRAAQFINSSENNRPSLQHEVGEVEVHEIDSVSQRRPIPSLRVPGDSAKAWSRLASFDEGDLATGEIEDRELVIDSGSRK